MPRTVQFSDQAYATLKALKKPGESFSATVMRLIAERKDPSLLLDLPPIDPEFDLDHLNQVSKAIDLERLRRRVATEDQQED